MTRDEACAITQTLLDVSAKVNHSVQQVMKSGCTGAQFTEYRRLAGRIMGNIYLHLLQPVFDKHPYLQPAETTSAQSNEPPLNRETAESLTALMSDVVSTIDEVKKSLNCVQVD